MRNILISLLVMLQLQLLAQLQTTNWNRPMQFKNCRVDIKAGQFTATTFIEMEFYNPNDQEIEGLHQFELRPGQAITAFQLELNGKYRDGTLEEKWKATNAYNKIVGKRIDPALLSMDYNNHYRLNIYPVPAKGSRKITFTIQQLLLVEGNHLKYILPFNIPDTLKHFHLSIQASNTTEIPQSYTGIISGKLFTQAGDHYQLQYKVENVRLNSVIAFSVPLKRQPILCTDTMGGQKYFALRFQPKTDTSYQVNPKELTVFWDASASAKSRDTDKEITFLQQFIAYHAIQKITVVPFNYKLLDTSVFNLGNGYDNRWKQYLRNITYNGATQLGCIDLKKNLSEITMLFTDGRNTYGNRKPKVDGALLFCITSSRYSDMQEMNLIVGASGGKVIDLNTTSMNKAITMSSHADNWLLGITSSSGRIVIEQSFPIKINQQVMINGSMTDETDSLFFQYGNRHSVSGTEQLVLSTENSCNEPAIKRLTMLQRFDKMMYQDDWGKVLDFGLEENVVTQHTAYIVLERVEDYIKYNIEAPKDLREECKLLQYVKSNTRKQRLNIKQQDEFDIVSKVVNVYNERVQKINKDEAPISLKRQDFEYVNHEETATAGASNLLNGSNNIEGKLSGISAGDNHLDEGVVIGYGSVSKRNITGSVVNMSRNEIPYSGTVEQALQGRVAGLTVTQNSGATGNQATISIRGSASIGGNSQPLFILDGIPLTGNINDVINVNDIDNITVLKGVEAGAMYGSRAVNGAIVISSKKGRNYSNYYHYRSYRLKDMEDVEYMQEIAAVPLKEKLIIYNKLLEEHATETGFYFDMAQHLFDHGLKPEALAILMNAAEVANGAEAVQHSIAWLLESWKMFEEAITVYEQLAADNNSNLTFKRDLAWAHYQQGNYQQAVDILYDA
ncbi:MAG: VIT domain-containing protein, partial [Sediminibacterium sp.]